MLSTAEILRSLTIFAIRACLGTILLRIGAQRAKIAEKVHKPPLVVTVINFELNELMLPYGSPGVPQSPKRYNSMIEVFKFIRFHLSIQKIAWFF